MHHSTPMRSSHRELTAQVTREIPNPKFPSRTAKGAKITKRARLAGDVTVQLNRRDVRVLTCVGSQKEADMAVRPIPEGYSSVTPYLIVSGAARAIDYYKLAF